MAEAEETRKTTEGNKEHDVNSAASWTHVRRCGAHAVAGGRMPKWQGSSAISWRAGVLDEAYPEICIKSIFDILENPLWVGAGIIKQAISRMAHESPRKSNSGKKQALKKWSDKFGKKAVAGKREAFNF